MVGAASHEPVCHQNPGSGDEQNSWGLLSTQSGYGIKNSVDNRVSDQTNHPRHEENDDRLDQRSKSLDFDIELFIVPASDLFQRLAKVPSLFTHSDHINKHWGKFTRPLERLGKRSTFADAFDYFFHQAAKMHIPGRTIHQPQSVQQRYTVSNQVGHSLCELSVEPALEDGSKKRQPELNAVPPLAPWRGANQLIEAKPQTKRTNKDQPPVMRKEITGLDQQPRQQGKILACLLEKRCQLRHQISHEQKDQSDPQNENH